MHYDKKAIVYAECAVELHGRSEMVDYGVPGSPSWEEVTDDRVVEIDIGRNTYTYAQLHAKIGPRAADWLVDELIGDYSDIEWEDL